MLARLVGLPGHGPPPARGAQPSVPLPSTRDLMRLNPVYALAQPLTDLIADPARRAQLGRDVAAFPQRLSDWRAQTDSGLANMIRNPAAALPRAQPPAQARQTFAQGVANSIPGYQLMQSAIDTVRPWADENTAQTALEAARTRGDAAGVTRYAGQANAATGAAALNAGMLALPAAGKLGEAVFGALPRGVAPVAGAEVPPIPVYHASPHMFREFDPGAIGTGEGAQAYGHGIYVAESPAVRDYYRDFFSGKTFGGAESGPAHTYEARLSAQPDEIMDLDTPASQQHPRVQQFVSQLYGLSTKELQRRGVKPIIMGPQEAEQARQAGFVALRYLDENSRGAGAGTYNYVVLDPRRLPVVARNGQPLPAPDSAPAASAPLNARLPTRASAGTILPAAVPQPIRQSLVGGSADLADAARMGAPDPIDQSGEQHLGDPQSLQATPVLGHADIPRRAGFDEARGGLGGYFNENRYLFGRNDANATPSPLRGTSSTRGTEAFSHPDLSPSQNKAVEMARNGFSNGEIADEMDTSTATVAALISQARNKGIASPFGALSQRAGLFGRQPTATIESITKARNQLLAANYPRRGLNKILADRFGLSEATVRQRLWTFDNRNRSSGFLPLAVTGGAGLLGHYGAQQR